MVQPELFSMTRCEHFPACHPQDCHRSLCPEPLLYGFVSSQSFWYSFEWVHLGLPRHYASVPETRCCAFVNHRLARFFGVRGNLEGEGKFLLVYMGVLGSRACKRVLPLPLNALK